MRISYKQLVEMLGESYDLGSNGPYDLKEELIDEVMSKATRTRELRIYTCIELRSFPLGTKVFHTLLGQGVVSSKKGLKGNFIKFENGVGHAFARDEFPWDMPMVRLD